VTDFFMRLPSIQFRLQMTRELVASAHCLADPNEPIISLAGHPENMRLCSWALAKAFT